MKYLDFVKKVKKDPSLIEQTKRILNDNVINESKNKKAKIKWAVLSSLGVFELALIIVLIVLAALSKEQAKINITVSVFITLGVFVFLDLFLVKYFQKKQEEPYIVGISEKTVDMIYGPNSKYLLSGGFSRDFLVNLNLFKVRTIHQEDMIKGHYDSIQCTAVDVHSYHNETKDDGTEYSVDDFLGTIINIKLNNPIENRFSIVPKKSDEKSLHFESEQFNSTFSLLTENPIDAENILTIDFQNVLVEIKNQFCKDLSLVFDNDDLTIVIEGMQTKLASITSTKSNKDNINKILDEILPPAYIINAIDINNKLLLNKSSLTDNTDEDNNSIGGEK